MCEAGASKGTSHMDDELWATSGVRFQVRSRLEVMFFYPNVFMRRCSLPTLGTEIEIHICKFIYEPLYSRQRLGVSIIIGKTLMSVYFMSVKSHVSFTILYICMCKISAWNNYHFIMCPKLYKEFDIYESNGTPPNYTGLNVRVGHDANNMLAHVGNGNYCTDNLSIILLRTPTCSSFLAQFTLQNL